MIELLLTLIFTLTGVDREADPSLMQLAQARSSEITCNGCFNHDGKPDGVAEILVWHQGGGNLEPQRAVNSWLNSPAHAAILFDPVYTRIGCGYTHNQANDGHYFACVLAVGDPTPPTPQPTVTTEQPDTALGLGYSPWLVTLGIALVIGASASRPRPGRKED